MEQKKPLICKHCNIPMNLHAEKEDKNNGDILEVHTCPKCGAIETQIEE